MAYSSGGDDPSNKATLDNLTNTFAYDFSSWLLFTGDESLAGICAVYPVPLYDFVEWDYMDDGVCRTRVASAPLIDHPRELGHHDYQGDCTTTDLSAFPCVLFYGPPGQCSGTHVQLTRYRLCLQDGRLFSTFVSTDNIT